METSLKEKILKLRDENKSYNEIVKILECSKAIISYHCKKSGKNNIGLSRATLEKFEIEQVNEYYKTHTTKETARKFNVSITTVKKNVDNKRVLLTEEEKKKKNYLKVKTHRQKIKIKGIEYKGGKCQRCGYKKSSWSLDFHHVNSKEKAFGIARYSTLSWEKIKKELDKCILICKNCHGELHEEEYLKTLKEIDKI